jgi:hypothetical protein
VSRDDQIKSVLHWALEARRDAGRLQAGIRSIERIIELDGPSGLAMTSLATLHAMRALALANAGACSEALVEISMAIDHNNRDRQLHQTQRALTALMDSMREKAASMRYVVDPRLNPEDIVIVAEARRGFAPMKLYQSSMRAVQTRKIARQWGS